MAKYIDRDGDLSVDKGLKNAWKFSLLDEPQNIQDLSSSKKVYYRDFFNSIFQFNSSNFISIILKKYTDIIWTYKDKLWRSSQKANEASKDCP